MPGLGGLLNLLVLLFDRFIFSCAWGAWLPHPRSPRHAVADGLRLLLVRALLLGKCVQVDLWAVGVCMVFLLANEYPFIDNGGRLLRDKLIVPDSVS
eukprot:983623-Amphidinium_carterae.1